MIFNEPTEQLSEPCYNIYFKELLDCASLCVQTGRQINLASNLSVPQKVIVY